MDMDYSSDEGDAVSTPLQEQGECKETDYLARYHPSYPACSAFNKSSLTLPLPLHDEYSGPGCKRAKPSSRAARPHLSPLSPAKTRLSKTEKRAPLPEVHSTPSSQVPSPISPTFGGGGDPFDAAFEPTTKWRPQSFGPSASSTPSRAMQRPYEVHTQGPVFSPAKLSAPSLSSSSSTTLTPSALPTPIPTSSTPARSPPRLAQPFTSELTIPRKAHLYSDRFPADHFLDAQFVHLYRLGDELGAGGYGFVMTARHRLEGREVAVKFIIKAKVPDHAWMEDRQGRRVPTEALLLGLLDHENIVKCVDLFEDELYFYLVRLVPPSSPVSFPVSRNEL